MSKWVTIFKVFAGIAFISALASVPLALFSISFETIITTTIPLLLYGALFLFLSDCIKGCINFKELLIESEIDLIAPTLQEIKQKLKKDTN